ncbi:MAG: helix-turn-helix transcriptional regulator, partial [Pirellulaceae bacterium]
MYCTRRGAQKGRFVFCDVGWRGILESLCLSPREFEIVQLIFDDANESTIAAELGLSQHTVHSHLQRVYRKLDVKSR